MFIRRSFMSFCVAIGMISSTHASENQGQQMELRSFVTSVDAGVVTAVFADLDGDGTEEALLSYAGECSQVGCLFSIVDDFGTGIYQVAAYQYGNNPVLVQDGAVINASGVYWIWNGRSLVPHGNALIRYFAQTGTLEDVEAIYNYEPWRKGISRFDIEAFDLDLFDDERMERVLYLRSLGQAIGQAFPFYIVDADGEVIDGDVSLGMPHFYRRSDRKATQYSFSHGNGFRVKMIE